MKPIITAIIDPFSPANEDFVKITGVLPRKLTFYRHVDGTEYALHHLTVYRPWLVRGRGPLNYDF